MNEDWCLPRPRAHSVPFILAVVLPLVLTFGFFRERTVTKRLGDFQVFCTAAWAAASGENLYGTADEHGWSYHYPPTLALLMRPFALPPAGRETLPHSLSHPAAFAVCFSLSALFFLLSIHLCGRSLALTGAISGLDGIWQKEWMVRYWPGGLFLIFALVNLGKGQVECLLLVLVTLFFWGQLREKPLIAGLALSLAIAIKMYPLALVLFPAARRDYKTLAALAFGGILWLIALPCAFWGWDATFNAYQTLWFERLAGILQSDPGAPVARELSFLSSDMVSVSAMLGRLALYGVPKGSVPPPAWTVWTQNLAGVILVVEILRRGYGKFWTWGKTQPPGGFALFLAGAILAAALPLFLPTAELQYWLLALPLSACLLVDCWRRAGKIYLPLPLLFWGIFAAAGVHFTENNLWRPLTILGPTTPVFAFLVLWGLRALRRAE